MATLPFSAVGGAGVEAGVAPGETRKGDFKFSVL